MYYCITKCQKQSIFIPSELYEAVEIWNSFVQKYRPSPPKQTHGKFN
jgi:hypothetical protein